MLFKKIPSLKISGFEKFSAKCESVLKTLLGFVFSLEKEWRKKDFSLFFFVFFFFFSALVFSFFVRVSCFCSCFTVEETVEQIFCKSH